MSSDEKIECQLGASSRLGRGNINPFSSHSWSSHGRLPPPHLHFKGRGSGKCEHGVSSLQCTLLIQVFVYWLSFTMVICLGIWCILWSKMKSWWEAILKLKLLWTPKQEATFSDFYTFFIRKSWWHTGQMLRESPQVAGNLFQNAGPYELKFGTLLETVFISYALH